MRAPSEVKARAPVHARILPAPDAPRVFALDPATRLERALPKHGVADVAPAHAGDWPRDGTVLLLRGDVAYDEAVLAGLAARPNVLLAREGERDVRRLAAHADVRRAGEAYAWLTGDGPAPKGVATEAPERIGETYRGRLRKREAPYCIELTREGADKAERRIYMGAYKGVTDAVTKYVWPEPALHATRACARLGITPNAVTFAGFVLVLAALWLFWQGAYGWGLLAAWVMTFLDTVDGKLARVTLTASPIGNVFDHGIDLVHPPFWYLAWAQGLAASGAALPAAWFAPVVGAIFVTYIAGRLTEGYFKRRFGVELFVWRRFDSLFRLVTARRNPCLVLLTLGWLAGRPDLGLLAVVAWHALSTAVQLVRLVQAEAARARGRTVSSWLQAPA